MQLHDVWFVLIAVLWTGYFFLEGFDFGVGMLLPALGRTERERTALLQTIGPVWDGNEVWLIVAAGATFASFPLWYATLFSGLYLLLLVILVALILRGVAFEFRERRDDARWRAFWRRAITGASVTVAVLWGAVFGNIVHGMPIDERLDYAGGLGDLINVFSLVGGLTTLSLFLVHGALFTALRTTGDLAERARRLAGRIGPATLALVAVFLVWTEVERGRSITTVTAALAAAALVLALALNRLNRARWAFLLTGATIALSTATVFLAIYPNVLPSTIDPAYSLTVSNAQSTDYTLTIMTWAAGIFLPIVLAYQGWTYWVFRQRINGGPEPTEEQPRSPQRAGKP
jgi:cytochrome d ubiquinol oxidase subunit II